jgi:hypothetical protein
MKTVQIAWLIFFICIASIFLGAHLANADEKLNVIEDCNYVPKQSDQVRYECDFTNANGVKKVLKGEGEVRVWICNKPYTIEIDCK